MDVTQSDILSRTETPSDYTENIWENPLPFLLFEEVTEKSTGRIGRVKTYLNEQTAVVVWVQFGHPAYSNMSKTADYEGEEVKIENLRESW